MPPVVEQLNFLLGIDTLLAQGAIVLLVVLLFLPHDGLTKSIMGAVKRYAFPLGFFAVLVGSALTLVYSDVFGFIPCSLCWFQRIFLYPQVVLLGIAWWKKDDGVWKYIIALSVLGVIVALYQHYLQMGGNALIPSPADGVGDCGKRFMFEFNYVTFPLMAATLFAWQLVLGIVARQK